MRFILKGKAYELTREDVERKMKRINPEPIRKHYVVINRTKYPPKQVLEICIGLPRIHFTTMNAASILSRLGFEFGTV